MSKLVTINKITLLHSAIGVMIKSGYGRNRHRFTKLLFNNVYNFILCFFSVHYYNQFPPLSLEYIYKLIKRSAWIYLLLPIS